VDEMRGHLFGRLEAGGVPVIARSGGRNIVRHRRLVSRLSVVVISTMAILAPHAVSAATAAYVHVSCSANAARVSSGDTPTVTCTVTTNSTSAYLNEIYPVAGDAAATVTAFCTYGGGQSQGLDGHFCEPPLLRPASPVRYYDTILIPGISGNTPVTMAHKICADGYTRATTRFSTCQTVHITVSG
jgi:hypothetical protein